jgi:hypothetical protein
MSFIGLGCDDESVERIASTSRSNVGAGSRGTLTSATSFTHADTLYIPYVGGQTRIDSCAGTQKQRRRASIASSEPTPRKRFSGVSVRGVWWWVLRSWQRRDLSGC